MKKTFLKTVISAGVVAATIGTLVPLGVSAQGKIGTFNTEQAADNAANESDIISNTDNSDASKTGRISCNDNVKLSYHKNCGVKQRGWVKVDGVWYYFDRNGNVKTGWIKDHGKWYYADSTGAMQTGVIKISGKVYYFNKSGVMQTGRVRIVSTI